MRILVTGGAGFIGSTLSDRLTTEGHFVGGVDNLLTGRFDNQGAWRLQVGDITDRGWFYARANDLKPDLIVHCAASYHDPKKWHRDTDTNIAGAINVANAAQHHGCPVVYFQTILPPTSSYAISKIAAEQYLRLSGVPLTVYKLANIYGPRNLSGAVPAFFKRLTAGQPCTVTDTTRNFVYITDLVDAVIDNLGVEGTFGVYGDDDVKIHELFLLMNILMDANGEADLIGLPTDDVAATRPVEDPPAGWKPRMPFDDGIARTIEWYSEHGVADAYTHLALKT